MGIDLGRFRKNRPSEWVEWLSDAPLPNDRQMVTPVQPQVHRPQASGQPVTPLQLRPNSASAGPPGLAQPIQPRTVTPQRGIRPAPRARPTQAARSFSAARPVRAATVVNPVVPSASASTQNGATTAVSIQISMPHLRMPSLPYKKIGYWAAGAAVCVGMVIGGWTIFKHFSAKKQIAVKAAVSSTPTFDPLAPKDKPQLGEGNGTVENTAYDAQRGIYAFKDYLMGFGVTVSQQALPDNLKKNPSELKKVAESMGGSLSTVETAFGPAYISTIAKNEAQRVVFAYQDRIVFLNSYKTFDNETWKYYIETLR